MDHSSVDFFLGVLSFYDNLFTTMAWKRGLDLCGLYVSPARESITCTVQSIERPFFFSSVNDSRESFSSVCRLE